ncbi:MAG: hypothetical protein A3E91_00415 [Candidatus Moranbacteria bacterium RIFCSPHIGHO2_12_FULL_40_10]|nr:MAG: hypothetical protein A3E91_00415 [Candidatus Moranbacteria bacterium RIFCSPHIGHO2_12_FULL_40_10]
MKGENMFYDLDFSYYFPTSDEPDEPKEKILWREIIVIIILLVFCYFVHLLRKLKKYFGF